MIQTIQLLLSLSILVVLHEFGHYITAKMFGCRVEKFYLFMDWKFALFKKKIGETEFGLGWLPLGGYVKISGFIDESMDASGVESDPEPWELRAKPAWQRLVVMLGGVVVNILLAWFIYSMILFSWGDKYLPMSSLRDGFSFNEHAKKLGFEDGDQLIYVNDNELKEYNLMTIMSSILFNGNGSKTVGIIRAGETMDILIEEEQIHSIIKNMSTTDAPFLEPNMDWVVGDFTSTSLAREAGLKVGDQIIAINDLITPNYTVRAAEYLASQAGKSVVLKIKRSSEGFLRVAVGVSDDGKIGVFPSTKHYEKTRSYSFLSSFSAGFDKTVDMTSMYLGQLKTIFNPKTGGYKHVGGVISIGKMFPGEWNWLVFWSMTALLSIILAIMNLLPIPALDGGHALIAIIEMVSGKKIPVKVLMPLQIAGMIMLFGLLIYANGMDVVRLFN